VLRSLTQAFPVVRTLSLTSMLESMRSKLFVPGSRPELFEKAWQSEADAVSFDLEDAVAASAKGQARKGLSHCRAASAKHRQLRNCQAAASAVRHVSIAAARSTRCVWAEVRWRWTLKVL
jgi:hypothetical protein